MITNITQCASAKAMNAYYESHLGPESATAPYYGREGDPDAVPRLGGKAALRLGLPEQLNPGVFASLANNIHPDSGERITANQRTVRRPGIDITINAPKSVSVVALVDPRVPQALRETVDEMLPRYEALVQTRVRARKQDTTRATGEAVYTVFHHTDARPVDGVTDPHLHAHAIFFNMTYDAVEKRFKAADFARLKQAAPRLEAEASCILANKLKALGYEIERTREGFEIAGVPRNILAMYSRRTGLIERVANERDITDPKAKAQLAAKTRERKSSTVKSPEEQTAGWLGRLTPTQVEVLRSLKGCQPTVRGMSASDAVREASAHLFERASVVPEDRLLREALKRSVGVSTVEEVQDAYRQAGFIVREVKGCRSATTRECLAEEQLLLELCRRSQNREQPLGSVRDLPAEASLGAEQMRTAESVLHSRDQVIPVCGIAGSGKTHLWGAMRAALKANGRDVVAIAPTAEAVDVLREAGFPEPTTVAAFLSDPSPLERLCGNVLLVDETSMCPIADLNKVLAKADANGCRTVLQGDPRQMTSPARGDAFRLVLQQAGLKTAYMTEIFRQRGELKRAVEEVASGRAEAAFARLDRLGCVSEIAEDNARYAQAADFYRKAIREGKSVLGVSPTHVEKDRFTQEIREALRTDGRLGKTEQVVIAFQPKSLSESERRDPLSYSAGDVVEFVRRAGPYKAGDRLDITGPNGNGGVAATGPNGPVTLPLQHAALFQLYRPKELRIASGDTVRCTLNGWSEGKRHRLVNGARYQVAGFAPDGGLQLTNGHTIPAGYGHLDHGYVCTSFGSQGKTVDVLILTHAKVSHPAASREGFYVGVSRARRNVHILTDCKESLKEAVSHSGERMSAGELIGDRGRPSLKERARELARRAREYAERKVQELRRGQDRVPSPRAAEVER